MSLNTVTVTWNVEDIGLQPLGGSVSFQLSVLVTDSADGTVIPVSAPQVYYFQGGTGTSEPLAANDNAALVPAGTYYAVKVTIAGQQPYSFNAAIDYANGATQTLAYLVANQAVPVAQYGQFMPLPSGDPLAGQVPVVQANHSTATSWEVLLGTVLSNRGGIQASTAYHPGDVVAYQGQHVLITQAVTSGTHPNWYTFPTLTAGTYVPLDGKGVVYAADWGVVSDTVTDNTAALTKCLYWGALGAGGGIVMLPPGNIGQWIYVSQTIIIPENVIICGHGIEDTYVKLMPNSNCDVFQFSEYGSSSQAAILSPILGASAPGAFSIRNAFYAGLMNLCVDGNWGAQAAGDYHNGLTVATNPSGSEAPTDPGYDPTNFLFNVEFTRASGEGYSQLSSRGQMRVTNCLFRSNVGWGAASGTDTLYTGCNFGANGIGGIYVQHSNGSGANNKLYNNGTIQPWGSGTAYTANTRVTYNGSLYGAINAVTSSTPPSSDTTNWAHISGATSPGLWGTGLALAGSTANQCSWSGCNFQANSGTDIYFSGATGNYVSGVSNTPNWNAPGAVQNGTNPNNYASVCLDNSTGNIVDIAATTIGTAYLLRSVNGSTHNELRFAGDSSWAGVLSPDSTALIGSGNSVKVNGSTVSDDGVLLKSQGFNLLATTGLNGYALVNGTGTILSWTAPNDGNLHRVLALVTIHVTSAETGGAVRVNVVTPDGLNTSATPNGGGAGVGSTLYNGGYLIQPNSTVTVTQLSALTGGAATVWAELWGQ